jgi:DNA-binding transcriptional LysR family regulator
LFAKGHSSAAAAELRISQPAISEHIAELQQVLAHLAAHAHV